MSHSIHIRMLVALFLLAFPITLWAQITLPVNNARNVPPDSQIHLTFPNPPTVGEGKIEALDAAGNVIDSIDVAQPTRAQTIGGLTNFNYYPVLIDSNQVILSFPNHTFNYNKTYSLKFDPGVFKDADGKPLKTPSITFTTQSASPKDASRLIVAADGTGDFSTLQGALDFIPDNNDKPVTVYLKKGVYREIVFFMNKNKITILGEDRKQTLITYANNERFNPPIGNPFSDVSKAPADYAPRTGGSIYHRGLFLAHRCSDLVVANLTLHNTTRQGGSQAESIILNGTVNARAMLVNIDLRSFQDTLQINGQAYVENCSIEGDTDFIWGTGPVFMQKVTCKSLRNAPFTQIRNPATNHGFVFNQCTLEGAPGVNNSNLGRIETARFPASELVFLDCVMTSAVSPVGYQITGAPANIHYWEYNSHDPDGKPVDVSKRIAGSRQLTKEADAEILKNYSDPKWVLGGEWRPTLPPIITTQPTR